MWSVLCTLVLLGGFLFWARRAAQRLQDEWRALELRSCELWNGVAWQIEKACEKSVEAAVRAMRTSLDARWLEETRRLAALEELEKRFLLTLGASDRSRLELEGFLLKLDRAEKARARPVWGALFVGTTPSGNLFVRTLSGQGASSGAYEVSASEELLSGSTLAVWGPVVLSLVRVHDTLLLDESMRAPFFVFAQELKAGAKIVFKVAF